MKRAIFALMLAVSLAAAPALAAAARPPVYLDIGRNFSTGAEYYFRSVNSWFDALLSLIGLRHKPTPGAVGSCESSSDCAPGLVCLNSCDDAACERFAKRCVKSPIRVVILGEFSACGAENLCAEGTDCTRVCPAGLDCGTDTYRCMKPVAPVGSCASDAECVSVCGQLPFAPIGPSAYKVRCAQNACLCETAAVRPDAPRVKCPDPLPSTMLCPLGTWPACTPGACPSGACPDVLTCLTAPDYGGICLMDAGCVDANCASGTEPFCGTDSHCKCRAKQVQTVSCATTSDCGASLCGANELTACVNGACSCAPAPAAPGAAACASVADCSTDCPQDYSPACEKGSCVCQKKTTVPFACQSVDDCTQVACPDGYDKGCQQDVCVCSRKIP